MAGDEALVRGCGVAIRVPDGRYAAWIEIPGRISAEVLDLDVREGAAHQALTSRMVPAASVVVHADGVDPSFRAALLHSSLSFRRELAAGKLAGQPILMPAGAVVVATFNRRGDVDVISRSIALPAGSSVTVDVTKQSEAALVAMLGTADDVMPSTFSAVAFHETTERPADLLLPRGSVSLAIWYGGPTGRARVEIRSDELFADAEETTVRERAVSTVRSRIRRRPALSIRLDASEAEMKALEAKKATLRLATYPEERMLAEKAIEGDAYRFENLPPAILAAVVEIDGWKLRQRIDLTAGVDLDETIEIDAVEVSGRVTYGRDPAPARIQFRGGDESVDAESDDTGRYEALLWQTGRFVVEVALRGEPQVPSFHDTFWIDAGTSTLDFPIPRTSYRVAVIDRESGKPVARASVGFLNRWNDRDAGKRTHARAVFTDDGGIAILPPLHSGDVELRVSAAGYREADVVRFVVPDGEPVADPPLIEIRLEGAGSGERVQVVLPDGSPAAGAGLMVVSDAVPSRPLFRGTIGADGTTAIPSGLEGSIVLVRHPATGALVRRWSGAQADADPWVLRPAAAPALVRVQASDETPVRFASIVVWVNGLAVSGAALMFLTDQPPQTDRDGLWTMRNLPPESFRIVALRRGRQVAEDALLPLATVVPFPWHEPVTLRLVE